VLATGFDAINFLAKPDPSIILVSPQAVLVFLLLRVDPEAVPDVRFEDQELVGKL